jgi:hypothetical protein
MASKIEIDKLKDKLDKSFYWKEYESRCTKGNGWTNDQAFIFLKRVYECQVEYNNIVDSYKKRQNEYLEREGKCLKEDEPMDYKKFFYQKFWKDYIQVKVWFQEGTVDRSHTMFILKTKSFATKKNDIVTYLQNKRSKTIPVVVKNIEPIVDEEGFTKVVSKRERDLERKSRGIVSASGDVITFHNYREYEKKLELNPNFNGDVFWGGECDADNFVELFIRTSDYKYLPKKCGVSN